ncbi:MAG: hypothetical protein QOE76_4045 [Frankiales bacterium]|nr:hypothetical protein [Frankiales bacterium]
MGHAAGATRERDAPAIWLRKGIVGADPLDEELSHRRTAKGEKLLPPVAGVVVAAAVYALLAASILFTPRVVIPSVETAAYLAGPHE